MKNKPKRFTKIDELLMLLDEYHDQLTLVIVLNLIPIILTSKLDIYFRTIYLESRFLDVFNFLSHQNSLVDFCRVLFYTYLIGLGIQLAGSKIKKDWVYTFNTFFLFIVTTYFWSIPNLESIFSVISSKHYIFIFVILFQIMFYFISLKRLFNFIIFLGNRTKINQS